MSPATATSASSANYFETFYKAVAKHFAGPFEPLLTLGLKATVKWVMLQGPILLRISALAGLVACIFTGGIGTVKSFV